MYNAKEFNKQVVPESTGDIDDILQTQRWSCSNTPPTETAYTVTTM